MLNLDKLIGLFIFAIAIVAFYRWVSRDTGKQDKDQSSRW